MEHTADINIIEIKITNLIRLSKKTILLHFFEKKTWEVMNELLNNQRRKSRVLTKLKDQSNNN